MVILFNLYLFHELTHFQGIVCSHHVCVVWYTLSGIIMKLQNAIKSKLCIITIIKTTMIIIMIKVIIIIRIIIRRMIIRMIIIIYTED